MQALQKKQAQSQALRDVLAGADGSIVNRSIEERVQHCKNLQYAEHQQLFGVLYSSIHKAACDNSISGVKYFLASKQKPRVHLDDYDQHGLCPLHMAAERGCLDVVKFIVDSGCDVDIRSTYGNTAMMYACKDNKLEMIRMLYTLGAKLTLKNKAGQSAMHYAAQGDHLDAVKLIVELNSQHHQRKELAVNLDSDSVSADDMHLDSFKGNGNMADDDSVTMGSVMSGYSASSEDAELASILNITANNLMTPLHMACLFNSERTAEYLLAQGVKINAIDSSGDTALHKAGRKCYHSLFKMLLRNGANEEIRNQFGDKASDLLRDNAFY